MDRTVKEITKALGTNKNVIYRIINRYNLEPVPTDNPKEPKRYSDDSFITIKKAYRTIQEKHDNGGTVHGSSDTPELILSLQNQIKRYETEIDRLNAIIEDKDATIKELAKTNHLETVRYQELIAREQSTKLLLTAQAQTRFNIFRPSTWKRNKGTDTPDLEPLTPDENS